MADIQQNNVPNINNNPIETNTNSITDVIDNSTKPVLETVNNTTNKVKDTLNTTYNNVTNFLNDPNIFWGLIIVIVVAIICALIMYYFIVEKVFNKKKLVIEETKYPIKGYVRTEIPLENIPVSGNGKRRTYSFWLYINDMSNMKNVFKNVFTIGDNKGNYSDKSPSVFLDKNNNILYVRFSKENEVSITGLDSLNYDNNFFKNCIKIDYIPLQRWVHVAIVVADNSSGGQIVTYIDSELVNEYSNSDKITYGSTEYQLDINNLDLDKSGYLVCGGDSSIGNNDVGFNGLLSKVTIINYDLNRKDIEKLYNEGPIDGLLASIGYGVRNPIYKL
jgi:hypothetical protein